MASAVACEYSRAIPREWPGLLEVSQSCLVAEGQPTDEAVTTMFTPLEPLGDEQLELNRYYGLGLTMRKLAQLLKPQEIRNQLIANAAGALAIRALEHMQDNKADVHVSEHLAARVFQQPFWSLCQQATNDLPPSEHLLVDALSAEGEKRVTARMFEEHPELDSSYIFKSVQEGTAAASVLSINVLGGASLITRHVVEKMSQARVPHNGSSASEGLRPTARELFLRVNDPESRFAADFETTMIRGAGLRIDEINDRELVSSLMSYGPHGAIIFDRTKLPKELAELPDHIQGKSVIHKQRLRCPAVHVSGLIPIVTKLLPEILSVAESALNSYTTGRVTL